MSTPANQLPDRDTERSPLRFVTAASLFDGHDAAINIMRRLIQSQGVEVVHLGHNRSVEDVVRAALQEDADGIALSSYQGGHTEYFKYMVDMLRERGAGHIRVFGGGGGTITPEEIKELQTYGVERIYHPNDGMQMGLVAMIEDLVRRTKPAKTGVRVDFPPEAATRAGRARGKSTLTPVLARVWTLTTKSPWARCFLPWRREPSTKRSWLRCARNGSWPAARPRWWA